MSVIDQDQGSCGLQETTWVKWTSILNIGVTQS